MYKRGGKEAIEGKSCIGSQVVGGICCSSCDILSRVSNLYMELKLEI